ncbi:MAG: hypothetical protein RL752_707, partial [Actinomycetota bacterium]
LSVPAVWLFGHRSPVVDRIQVANRDQLGLAGAANHQESGAIC